MTSNQKPGGKSIEDSIDRLKKDLGELRQALNLPNEDELKKMPEDVLKRLTDVAHDVVTTGSDFAEKSLRILRLSAEGAVEGAKKGMNDDTEAQKKKTTPPKT